MFHDRASGLRPDLIQNVLDRTAQALPQGRAVDFFGRVWTWRDIADEVMRVAAGLQRLGVKKGDRVGLCLPNMPHSVIAYYAILKVGAVVVNYSPLYVERELEGQIRDSGTTLMFTTDLRPLSEKVAAVAARTGLKVVVCRFADALPRPKAVLLRLFKRKMVAGVAPGQIAFADLGQKTDSFIAPDLSLEDIAVLQYTGGTTGVPKGAVLTHGNIIANAEQVAAVDDRRRFGEDRVLGVLPLFHVYAMTVVMNYSIMTGAEMVLLPRYQVDETLAAAVRRRVTVFPAVPTIYGAIAKAAQSKARDLSSVRTCISGGAPLPLEIADLFEKVTGARVVEGYGLTEASPTVCCNPVNGLIKHGSVGLPLERTIVEIRDPLTRALMPPNEKGELVIRGPQVMRGYWQRPEETANVLDEYGLRTGDIGYKDEDGYVFVVDRIKDLIISGGYNVYPRVIEEALYQHEAVAEAIVIGIPDAYRGQSAKAFVTLRPGATTTPAELSRFLEDHLSKIERPKAIEIRAQLPKTAVGKLSRKELVAEELAEAAETRRT
jgi:long-chain acyl-CoA synthetase